MARQDRTDKPGRRAGPPPWLKPALAYAQDWVGYQMRASEAPGCVLAVAWRGQILLETAFGHANLYTGEALSPRHRFRVASHSKSFTAAAIMKLREQRRLKLDDAVGDYVRDLHPTIGPATLGQLLSHTAGIFRDGLDAAYWEDRAPFSDRRQLMADLRQPAAIEANTRLKYSNHGFALLGQVIEAVTGETYGAWVTREVIEAAGLGETSFDVPLAAGAKLARGHSGKTLLGRRLVFPGDASTHALAPATGFVSTAADLLRFFGQLAPAARSRWLSPASRREMIRPQWPDPFGLIEQSYGLGIGSGRLEGWDWFGHGGGFLGYLTRTAVIPSQELAISALTNAADGNSNGFVDGLIGILQRFHAEGPPDRSVAGWTGRWWSVWGATDLLPVGRKVLLASPALMNPVLKAAELTVTGPDEAIMSQASAFHSPGEPVRLRRNAKGEITELRMAAARMVPEAVLSRELLRRYDPRTASKSRRR